MDNRNYPNTQSIWSIFVNGKYLKSVSKDHVERAVDSLYDTLQPIKTMVLPDAKKVCLYTQTNE